jgi:periplasmic protein TonB
MLRTFAQSSRWSINSPAPGSRTDRWIGIACAIALHFAAIGALLQYQPVREALVASAPIMVNLIAPPQVEQPRPPEPEPPKPKPKPVQKPRPKPVQKPIEPPPIVTAPIEAPSPVTAPPPPPPEPLPPIEALPQLEPAPPPPPPPPVTPPRFNADYLRNPAPNYPLLSRRMGEQGKVLLRVFVNADGNPEKVELRTSSGSPRLDQSALDTVKHWKFVPARQGDQPVAAWVLVPISFALEG